MGRGEERGGRGKERGGRGKEQEFSERNTEFISTYNISVGEPSPRIPLNFFFK